MPLGGFKIPSNNDKYHWTNHVIRKMIHYGLSPMRVLRVIRAPQRMEEGIAPNTLAAMQKIGTSKRASEIWVMYAEHKKGKTKIGLPRKVIVTAWRYPGSSPIREAIPIPHDILEELKRERLI